MGNEVADASVWQARAAAWELAALSLRYPDAELAEAAAGGEWDEAAREILAALGLPAEVPAAAGDPAGPPAARAADAQAAAGADALLRALEPFGIKELAQSGMVAIGRGGKSITERVLRS